MSKAKRRNQANNRAAFALGITPEQWAELMVARLKPHQILRFMQRRVAKVGPPE